MVSARALLCIYPQGRRYSAMCSGGRTCKAAKAAAPEGRWPQIGYSIYTNSNRFRPISSLKRRSTVPSTTRTTISQVALTTARFK